MRKTILFIFGTRPEAIKMSPLIKEFQKNIDFFEIKICVSAQHREMLDNVLYFFEIVPDYDLDIMSQYQTLFQITRKILEKVEYVLDETKPDLIFVQGDTTTTFVGALAGFYKQIKVAHLEAGLRSRNRYSPFPEEANRILTGHLADFHFAPTPRAKNNLVREGITMQVYVVGNTAIDALFLGLSLIDPKEENYRKRFGFLDPLKRLVLVTGHRRESFGKPFENICFALKDVVSKFDDIQISYPVHLNPNVQEPVNRILKDIDNVHLIEPVDYPAFLWLMKKSYIILTDSGGIQEEAPSLGIPVLVMREVTERVEGIESRTAKLVGTNREAIVNEISTLIENEKEYHAMSDIANPYGDGKTSKRIVEIVKKELR